MHPFSRARFLVLLAGLIALVGPPPARAADLAAARTFVLDDGLTVVALHEPAQPVVAVQVLYKVGARNETIGLTGISHFVEHMLFRGTEHFGLGDITGVIERAGGEWHGYTYLDCTTFFEAAPRDLLPTLLRLEAERMTVARMAAGEVKPERGAVFQEYRGYQNDARSDLFDLTMAALFLQHPYRNNTMGWESDLAGISHDDLLSYYRRYYGPRNAVLAIAGDFDPAGLEARVREAFAKVAARGDDTAIRTVEPAVAGPRRVTLRRRGASPSVMVSFLAPPPSRPGDYASLMLLDAVLSGPRGLSFRGAENDQTAGAGAEPGSRLGRALASSAAERFGSAFVPTLYPYHYSIYASPKEGRSPDEIPPTVFASLAEAAASVTPQEVDKARRRIAAALLLETDSPVDLAHELAFWTGLGGLQVREAIVRELSTAGAAQVRALARTFVPGDAVIGVLLPEDEDRAGPSPTPGPAPTSPMASTSASSSHGIPSPAQGSARSSAADAAPELRPARTAAVETLDLGPRARAIVDARPSQKTFVLEVAATFDPAGGTRSAGAGRLRAAARGLREDTGELEILGDLGVRFTIREPAADAPFSERDALRVGLAGPAPALAAALVAFAPAFRRALGTTGRADEARSTDPETLALQRLDEALAPPPATGAGAQGPRSAPTPNAPSGLPDVGLALVSPYPSASLRDLLAALVPDRAAPRAAGPAGGATGQPGGASAPFPPGRRVETLPAIAQGRLLFAFPGGADADALRALTWILHHDYGGRLGVRAIAELGLVYSMDSEAVTRGRPLAVVTMGAAPEKLPDLEKALGEVLDQAAAALSDREVADYRSFAQGDLAVRLADPAKAARLWSAALLEGEDHRGPKARVERARALTRERVADLARRALAAGSRLTILVTRDGASPVP